MLTSSYVTYSWVGPVTVLLDSITRLMLRVQTRQMASVEELLFPDWSASLPQFCFSCGWLGLALHCSSSGGSRQQGQP